MSTEKEYDHLVFIGRFQPFHNGHKHVIDTALKLAKHVIVLVGSSNTSPNTRNPFTFEQREQLILSCFLTASGQPDPRISVIPLEDYTYNDGEWTRAVSRQVNNFLSTQYPSTTY